MVNVGKVVNIIITLLLNSSLSSAVDFKKAENNYQYSSYQKGIFCNATYLPVTPTSLLEIQHIVEQALVQKLTLKPVGNLYSITDIICTDGVPIHMVKINQFRYDPQTGLTRIGAGASLAYLTKNLDLVGRALEGMPALSDITVGGAIATGAHGSSLSRKTTLSSQLVELTVVDGCGNVVQISEKTDTDVMNAFRVNLGLLGIIYEVTLRTIPQYKVHTHNVAISDTILLDNVKQLVVDARNADFFHFFWFPTAGQVVLSKSNIVSTNTEGNCETNFIPEVSATDVSFFKGYIEFMNEYKMDLGLYLLQWFSLKSLVTSVFGKTPLFTHANAKNGKFCSPSIGYSHKMLTNLCVECPWNKRADSVSYDESAVLIPLIELAPAIETIRTILESHPVEFYLTGILFRFIKSSSALMDINQNMESVGIEWVLAARAERSKALKTGVGTTQALNHALVIKHQGRTHWGKNGLYFSSPEMIQFQHQRYREDFVNQMERWDPNGVFLNEFGRRIRYLENNVRTSEHCALVDSCVCEKDRDCGEGGICSEIMGFKVCKAGDSSTFRWLNRMLISGLQAAFLWIEKIS